jgi:hypothetical protein
MSSTHITTNKHHVGPNPIPNPTKHRKVISSHLNSNESKKLVRGKEGNERKTQQPSHPYLTDNTTQHPPSSATQCSILKVSKICNFLSRPQLHFTVTPPYVFVCLFVLVAGKKSNRREFIASARLAFFAFKSNHFIYFNPPRLAPPFLFCFGPHCSVRIA